MQEAKKPVPLCIFKHAHASKHSFRLPSLTKFVYLLYFDLKFLASVQITLAFSKQQRSWLKMFKEVWLWMMQHNQLHQHKSPICNSHFGTPLSNSLEDTFFLRISMDNAVKCLM